MKREEALYLLKEVYAELIVEHPEVKIEVYRDGGSIAFVLPLESDSFVMLAPVTGMYDGKNRIGFCINHADVLKEGCTRFDDSFKKENIYGTVSLENRDFMRGDGSVFNRDKAKRDLVAMVKGRLSESKNE